MKHIIDTPEAPAAAAAKTMLVDEESAGQRLDNFLLRHLKGVPKTHVYRIIRTGEVRINKGRVNADTRVQTGDVVRLPPVRVATVNVNAPVAPGREFPVLMEDEQMMAIDKPAGVAVHGGSGVSFGVIEQLRQARPGARMLELVHRLDRDTSGVLLVAKKRSALTRLQDQFRDRETGKTYLALVKGQWPSNKKVIDLPLQRYLIPNGVTTAQEGYQLFERINQVCARFLNHTVRYLGSIENDEMILSALKKYQSVLEFAPGSSGSRDFRRLAEAVCQLSPSDRASGGLQFFLERLVKARA